MKKAKEKDSSLFLLGKATLWMRAFAVLAVLLVASVRIASAAPQQNARPITVKGVVVDEKGETMPMVTIMVKGSNKGFITDFDGNFIAKDVAPDATLTFSYTGYLPRKVNLKGQTTLKVVLNEDTKMLDEVVVVGYGQQKKASVVGAISQVKGEDLKRTGGVTNLAQALTGLLPGVQTFQTNGRPGEETPAITIRGVSSWNTSSPLVLVDGVERSMNDIDVNEVETISVLKDASATAVYGVRGAEGVILVTTKKGQDGKPQFSFSADVVFKFMADMQPLMDSYDAYMYQNAALERELPLSTKSKFDLYMPYDVVRRYRYYQSPSDMYRYPNVDWTDVMTRDYGLSQRYSLQVSGGTKFVKYFASLAYLHEGDIIDSGAEYGLPDEEKYTYDRYNYRMNFDFNLTPTTVLTTRIGGFVGIKDGSMLSNGFDVGYSYYRMSSAYFPVVHPRDDAGNIVFGYYAPDPEIKNPMSALLSGGKQSTYQTQVNTDFVLRQQLDFITKGLSAQASFSFDTNIRTHKDSSHGGLRSKYIDPLTGAEDWNPKKGNNEYDWVYKPGSYSSEGMFEWDTYRLINYQFQINYNRKFGKHDVGAMAVMSRQENAYGNAFPNYREEWAARVTYSYADRYLFEANGAYNGSEKYARKYRFGFFPSFSAGWMITEEPFFRKLEWLTPWVNKLKVRYSWGKVGSDNVGTRWGYMTNWGRGGQTYFGPIIGVKSPYIQYGEGTVGNPDLQWEETTKQNLGIEWAVYKNRLTGSIDIFSDRRDKVFVASNFRSIPTYYGSDPVSANLGKTKTHGYELDLRYTQTIGKAFSFWLGYSLTYAKDKIILKDDPELRAAYRKQAGFQIDQTTSQIDNGMIKNWDDAYAYPRSSDVWTDRLPGDYATLDFNGNGVIDKDDSAPYGFPGRPQYTYNMMGGLDWKGFSFLIQFYGAWNVTQRFDTSYNLGTGKPPYVTAFMGDYWSVDNPDGNYTAPRANSSPTNGTLNYYDGSYLRLKNVELSYTYRGRYLKAVGLGSVKLLVSGNNLCFWSKLPEDRERYVGTWTGDTYPNIKRVNVGVNITF